MSGFKRRSAADLSAQLTALTGQQDFSDAGEWKLTTDKLGNGSAVIRFLPAKDEGDTPFVKVFSHGFKENGRWYIENCLTTIGGQDCPVCNSNRELWNSDIKANKDIASLRKRKLSYWANIVVIKDEAKPENVGKVFKFRFGKKIMDKILAASTANEELGTTGMDITCVFEGANFLFKSKKVGEHLNYDDSLFGAKGELFGGNEDELARVWSEMHDIKALIAEKEFKTPTELQTKFTQVTGAKAATPTNAADDALNDLDDLGGGTPVAPKTAGRSAPAAAASSSDADLDDLLSDLGI